MADRSPTGHATFDSLDRKLLAVLDRDARLSTSEIARRVGHGRDIVDYRLARLFAEKSVLGTSAVINPCRLGLSLFKTYLRVRNDGVGDRALRARLLSSPEIFCVAECDGQWDLIFNTLARTPSEFDRLQSALLSEFAETILEFDFAIVIEQSLFPRAYPGLERPGTKAGVAKSAAVWRLGGEGQSVTVEPLELEILSLLAEDARLSVAELSRRTDAAPAVIQNRIERLETRGVIVGYRSIPNLAAFGLTSFKTQLTLRSYAQTEIARLRDFAGNHPQIVKAITQVGSCKLELGLEASDHLQFAAVTQELRAAFPDLISSLTTIFVRREHYRWISDRVFLDASEQGIAA